MLIQKYTLCTKSKWPFPYTVHASKSHLVNVLNFNAIISKKLFNQYQYFPSGIWNYMENIRCVVMDLSLRVSKAQQNVETIKNMMQAWREAPMFIRDDGKTDNLLNIKGKKFITIQQSYFIQKIKGIKTQR